MRTSPRPLPLAPLTSRQALLPPPPKHRQKANTLLQGKAKYNAWKKVVDDSVTPDAAQEQYVKLVEELKEKYGYDENKVPEAVGGN